LSLGRAIDEALEAKGASGTVEASADGATAEVDVVDVDRLGVRVRGIRVRRAEPFDVDEEARELPERMRSLPDRIEPVEVDRRLGGAILRSKPEEMRDREFFELGLTGPRDMDLKRLKAEPGQEREPTDWTMSRKGLGRLLDEME
jgi:hypothetical protein